MAVNEQETQTRYERPVYPAPTRPEPELAELMEWDFDGVCEATDGCQVEPDGVCGHGHPSWLLYLGYI